MLHVLLTVTSQQIDRQFPTATGLFDEILVLEFYFILPVAKYLCSNRSSVLFASFLARIFFGKFPIERSFSFLFVVVRVNRH
jgi:hypothetical protein